MSKSYTPGLKVLRDATITKNRLLPLKGSVHVKQNDDVDSDTIVASTEIPGNVHMINIANELNVDVNQVNSCMLVKSNESIEKDQLIAQSQGIFGMFKTDVKSPINGKIINISNITGQVVISEHPVPINVDAYIPGKINSIYENEGVLIDSVGTFVQGIIGIGGEQKGKMIVLVEKSSDLVQLSDIDDNLKDKIIVCGSYINLDIYKKAKLVGVKGIVCGGVDYNDVSDILGYSLGVAITGTEDTTTLILTEGFGRINMADRTFNILKENNKKYVSINGATQIRAGVLRPEIFIKSEGVGINKRFDDNDLIISKNSTVRVIREPYFGKIGKIISLPKELMTMKSETKVRVAEVEFEDKTKVIIPRANLEVILSN
tara:strand:+ start:2344 stop:3465 length:1122 start_codon:yes stop_codon:yes gene_type:complete